MTVFFFFRNILSKHRRPPFLVTPYATYTLCVYVEWYTYRQNRVVETRISRPLDLNERPFINTLI